jgi:hypothetical protein
MTASNQEKSRDLATFRMTKTNAAWAARHTNTVANGQAEMT